ncbi:hypothetical protein PR048_022840 [Dryococelus australis]|uniref:Uncharacterized protein n=1 Tax=Dryococelus australis TaxID=614101 RepID=A0ABQ9GSH4_9NEOP|nr:hypothetical protein PR048_022840 [Dryococelus australis]
MIRAALPKACQLCIADLPAALSLSPGTPAQLWPSLFSNPPLRRRLSAGVGEEPGTHETMIRCYNRTEWPSPQMQTTGQKGIGNPPSPPPMTKVSQISPWALSGFRELEGKSGGGEGGDPPGVGCSPPNGPAQDPAGGACLDTPRQLARWPSEWDFPATAREAMRLSDQSNYYIKWVAAARSIIPDEATLCYETPFEVQQLRVARAIKRNTTTARNLLGKISQNRMTLSDRIVRPLGSEANKRQTLLWEDCHNDPVLDHFKGGNGQIAGQVQHCLGNRGIKFAGSEDICMEEGRTTYQPRGKNGGGGGAKSRDDAETLTRSPSGRPAPNIDISRADKAEVTVSKKQSRNEIEGETGERRENPPTNISPARFPLAKIRGRRRRESNTVHLGETAASTVNPSRSRQRKQWHLPTARQNAVLQSTASIQTNKELYASPNTQSDTRHVLRASGDQSANGVRWLEFRARECTSRLRQLPPLDRHEPPPPPAITNIDSSFNLPHTEHMLISSRLFSAYYLPSVKIQEVSQPLLHFYVGSCKHTLPGNIEVYRDETAAYTVSCNRTLQQNGVTVRTPFANQHLVENKLLRSVGWGKGEVTDMGNRDLDISLPQVYFGPREGTTRFCFGFEQFWMKSLRVSVRNVHCCQSGEEEELVGLRVNDWGLYGVIDDKGHMHESNTDALECPGEKNILRLKPCLFGVMEKPQNARTGKTGPPLPLKTTTSGIVQDDSHIRKSRGDPTGNRARSLRSQSESGLDHTEGTIKRHFTSVNSPILCHGGRRRLDQRSPGLIEPHMDQRIKLSQHMKWLRTETTLVYRRDGPPFPTSRIFLSLMETKLNGNKVDVQHVYTEIEFAIGSQFIRHALDYSEPIADLLWNGVLGLIGYCHLARKSPAADCPTTLHHTAYQRSHFPSVCGWSRDTPNCLASIRRYSGAAMITGGVAPGFPHAIIVPDDAAGRRDFFGPSFYSIFTKLQHHRLLRPRCRFIYDPHRRRATPIRTQAEGRRRREGPATTETSLAVLTLCADEATTRRRPASCALLVCRLSSGPSGSSSKHRGTAKAPRIPLDNPTRPLSPIPLYFIPPPPPFRVFCLGASRPLEFISSRSHGRYPGIFHGNERWDQR